MKSSLHRRGVLHAGLALGVSLAWPRVQACQFDARNFKLIHPWTRATEDGADTAIVSMGFEEVTEPDVLIGVETAVAERAELGGIGAGPTLNFAIAAGQSSALSESGTYLRLLGLKLPLQVGRSYPMNLLFRQSGLVLATLTVDFGRFN